MRDLEDPALVALYKATRHSEAFNELYRRHIGVIRGYLISIGASSANVDDLAQKTFLTALQKIGQFRGDASFRTWLFTIGYRHHLQHWRRKKSEDRATQQLQRQAEIGRSDFQFENDESLTVAQALERLSEEERSALILCDAYGYTHSEAAGITGRPLGTLKSHVRRARIRTKAILERGDESERDE